MKYLPQEGDTTMDEALGLLQEATELLSSCIEDSNDPINSFLDRAERFLADNDR